jgi:hypothetical protein
MLGRMVMVNRSITVGALQLALLLGLQACGGDDDGADEPECTEGGQFGNVCPPPDTGGDSGSGGLDSDNPGGGGAGSGSGGPSGGGNAGRGAQNPDGTCASGSAYGRRVVPTIHLVVDGSCSMELELTSDEPYGTCDIEEPGPTTRWGALRHALTDAQAGILFQLQDAIRFGFTLFGTDPQCPIVQDPIAPDLNLAQAIADVFPVQPPGSNTPTGLALQQVVDTIAQTLTSDPDAMMSPQLILLATDGAPNSCGDSTIDFQPSLTAANAARDAGIVMYVLSLAPTTGDYATHLQEMADIGLDTTAAPVYSPSSPTELSDTLTQLIGGAINCEVVLNGSVDPEHACDGQVLIGGDPLECGTEWELVDERTIRLLGDRCDAFKSDQGALLTANWPCGVFTVD